MTNRSTFGISCDVEPNVVHVWLINIGSHSVLESVSRPDLQVAGIVSEEDEARAASFLDPAEGDRLRTRRKVLRIILAKYVACEPADVGIVTAPGGKPVIVPGSAGSSTHAFSVSHSSDLYAVAVGRGSSLGVDVERIRPLNRSVDIANRWFGPDEAAGLHSLNGEEGDLAFMELWTAKEALAKRHGAGLRLMHGQRDADRVRSELDVAQERDVGRLMMISPQDGYVGAVASSESLSSVEILREGDPRWII